MLTCKQVMVPLSRTHVQQRAQQAASHNPKNLEATGVGIGLVLLTVLTYIQWQRAQQTAANEEEEQDLAGVGIVFVRAPDDSLFVKSVVDGSGATNSGIQPGDCLMKVSAWVLAAQHCVPFGLDVCIACGQLINPIFVSPSVVHHSSCIGVVSMTLSSACMQA